MADPVLLDTPKDEWTLIAENVLTGLIDRRSSKPAAYYMTTRPTGSPPPPITDLSDPGFLGAQRFIESLQIHISANEPTDVYVLCQGDDGRVLVTK